MKILLQEHMFLDMIIFLAGCLCLCLLKTMNPRGYITRTALPAVLLELHLSFSGRLILYFNRQGPQLNPQDRYVALQGFVSQR